MAIWAGKLNGLETMCCDTMPIHTGAGGTPKAPVFTREDESNFIDRLKQALEEIFADSIRTNNVNSEVSRAAEAYALVCATETKLDLSCEAAKRAWAGDVCDTMQAMKGKLRSRFEAAALNSPPAADETIQMARTYAALIESQALRIRRPHIIRT